MSATGYSNSEALSRDDDEQVNRDGDPDLGPHGVGRGAVERLDLEVLLDPLEEQLDLPPEPVDVGDGERLQHEVVGEELEVHFILDNYATHKHPNVRAWLERNPRVQFHFVPTYASWLNLVERFFSELTMRQLKRLAVNSVNELIDRITEYIEQRNQNPKPFTWTASVNSILRKVAKAKMTLASQH